MRYSQGNPRSIMTIALLCITAVVAISGCSPKNASTNQATFVRLDPGGNYAYAHPKWSPDSSRIVYTRYEIIEHPFTMLTDTGEIWVMDVNTREAIQLTQNGVADLWPTWSPDGQQIAYVSEKITYEAGQTIVTDSLRIINAGGSGDKEVFQCPFSCGKPSWSPSGEHLAFHMLSNDHAQDSINSTSHTEIYTINLDGTDLTRRTEGVSNAWGPRWSPDGQQIVFQRQEKDSIRIFDLQKEVEFALNLYDVVGAQEPTWAPDQSHILFSADRIGRSVQEMYLYDISDEMVERMFTEEEPIDMNEPDWSPDGRRIVLSVFLSQLYLVELPVSQISR